MDLREKLLRGIYAYGFEKPSAIQQRAIMPSIKGERNCFAVAIAKICCNLWFNLNGYLQTRIRVNKNPWQHWIMYLVNISLTTPKGLLPVSKILVSCKTALLLKNPRKMLFKIMSRWQSAPGHQLLVDDLYMWWRCAVHTQGSFCVRPANERQCYIVTSSLIGWAHKMIPALHLLGSD